MKELSGQPFDLVKKLDSMRSSSSSKQSAIACWKKIIQLQRHVNPPRRASPKVMVPGAVAFFLLVVSRDFPRGRAAG